MAQSTLDINRITLRDMIFTPSLVGLADGFAQLPSPQYLKIGRRYFLLPETYEAFTTNICYGQRIYFGQNAENDFDVIIRMVSGYFYPLITGRKWNGDDALLLSKNIITCRANEIYPSAMLLVNHFTKLAENEVAVLNRQPSKTELAAGIEKLNRFADMMTLDFLRDTMKVTIQEVLLTPYNEILVRLMMAKEVEQYRERYTELIYEEAKPKPKYVKNKK